MYDDLEWTTSMVTAMADSFDIDAIRLDHRTSLAICEGIGERLRDMLKPNATPLPQHLQELMNRLKEIEDAPSITPDVRASR